MIGRIKQAYEDGHPLARLAVGAASSVLPPDMRFGSAYRAARRDLASSAAMSAQEQAALAFSRLKATIEIAAIRTPYYRECFRRVGFTPEQLKTWSDIERIPLLTRELVREQGDRLVPEGMNPVACRYTTTGGTTSGTPLGFYVTYDASAAEWAFINDAWTRAGWSPDAWRAVLRGAVVGGRSRGRLWERDPLRRAIVFSAFDMTPENIDRYIDQIRTRRLRFVHAYPSSATLLANRLAERGERFDGVTAWLLSSETLAPSQRDFLESLGPRVLAWYGHSEKCVLAAECEAGEGYHPYSLYGHTELVADDGRTISDPGIRGTVVGTGYLNRASLLIRYATDDRAEWITAPCRCGRAGGRLTAVEGRTATEALVGRAGSRIGVAALNLHASVYAKLRRFQFVQDKVGSATMYVVAGEGFSSDDRDELMRQMQARLAGQVDLSLELVSDIPLSPAGKHRHIVQRIADAEGSGPSE